MLPVALRGHAAIVNGNLFGRGTPAAGIPLLAPVPFPTSCRDGYAFRQHVAAARRNRKVEMIPEFDQYPIFYFTNHHSIKGPGEISCMPDHFEKLDFELEVAIVICKHGRNIKAEEADEYIGGLMIMNDLSARVGTGCFLELNGTGKLNDPNYPEQWLQNGDVVEMEIDQLGILSNTIVAEETDWSILNKI